MSCRANRRKDSKQKSQMTHVDGTARAEKLRGTKRNWGDLGDKPGIEGKGNPGGQQGGSKKGGGKKGVT